MHGNVGVGTGPEADTQEGPSISLPTKLAARASGRRCRAARPLDRHASRLARGLATVVNVFDPEVIVLGGGLSKLAHLYDVLPAQVAPHVFADAPQVTIKPPRWGDAGGVRGAAWLWG